MQVLVVKERKKERKKIQSDLQWRACYGSFAPCNIVDCAQEVVTMCAPDSHASNSKQIRMYNLNILRVTQSVISFE